ncbi:MAG TPA: hypothetical protein PLO99_11180 [Chitinophagaceae bacterium]|nr:hypothetical protein [Chitinophagaceae bacterium]
MQRKFITTFLYCIFFTLLIQLKAFTQTGGIPTGTDTSCSNGISFYQKVYGGNKDETGEWLVPTADSGYVIVGHTNSFGSGGYDGLLMRVNKKGSVVWSRTVGGTGNDVLYGVKATSDNGFIAVGQTKSYGNNAGDGWLVKVDASGAVQWSKKYGDGNVFGESVFDVVQLSDGGYAFCGAHQFAGGVSQSFVVRTDNSGNVIWSKQYDQPGSDEAWGLTEDGTSLVVVGFYRAPDLYDGYMMKLDKSTGSAQWRNTYDAEFGRHMLMAKVRVINTGYQVFSLIMDDFAGSNQQQCIWNIGSNGSVLSLRKIVIPGLQTSGYGWTPLADGGFVVANGENITNPDILLTQVNVNGTIGWSKKYIRNGRQVIRSIAASPEGGYAGVGINNITGTATDSSNIFLLRIDSMGGAGYCSGINTSEVSVETPSFSSSSIGTGSPGNVSINNPVITVSTSPFVPVTSTLCYYCYVPIPITPIDTSCINGISLYQKVYGGNKDETGEWLVPTADSGYVIVGHTNSFGNGGYDGLLMRVNKKGSVQWSRAVGGAGDDALYGVKATSDNGFIAIGQTKSYGNIAGDGWLVKVDAGGVVQWSKKYGDGNVFGEAMFDVVQLSDGGYAFCGAHQFAGGVSQSFVIRTDNSGNVIWSKQYDQPGSDEAWGLTEDGNSLIVVGFYRAPDLYDGYMMKLDKASGSVQWKNTYDAEFSRHMLMAKVRVINNGYQVFSLIMDDFTGSNQQQCIWNIGTNGTVQNIRKIVIPGIQTSGYGWLPFSDGGFVVANGENLTNPDVLITQVNANGTIGWSRKYVRNGRQVIRSIAGSSEGGYAALGINNNVGTTTDSSNIYLLRIDSLGGSGSCSGIITSDVTVEFPAFTSSAIGLGTPGNVSVNNPVINIGTSTFVPVTGTLCFYCQPKPLGTTRPSAGVDADPQHQMRLYPNPVVTGTFYLDIDARFEDFASVNIIDMNGTVQYVLSPRRLLRGQNIIRVELPVRLRNYTNYLVSVQFGNYSTAAKIFVLR